MNLQLLIAKIASNVLDDTWRRECAIYDNSSLMFGDQSTSNKVYHQKQIYRTYFEAGETPDMQTNEISYKQQIQVYRMVDSAKTIDCNA
jgi:hypothetical protein